jgi:hypothetical protein
MRTDTGHAAALVVAPVVALSSCNRLTPAGFWKSYRSDMIAKANSDQGPWGGSRWIQWVAKGETKFSSSELDAFAKTHGWTCEPPVEYSSQRTKDWVSPINKEPIFPLFFGEPTDPVPYTGDVWFPRHIDGDSYVMKCETGWERVAPGSGVSSPAYGYIQVSKDGHRLAIYHLWGEV